MMIQQSQYIKTPSGISRSLEAIDFVISNRKWQFSIKFVVKTRLQVNLDAWWVYPLISTVRWRQNYVFGNDMKPDPLANLTN